MKFKKIKDIKKGEQFAFDHFQQSFRHASSLLMLCVAEEDAELTYTDEKYPTCPLYGYELKVKTCGANMKFGEVWTFNINGEKGVIVND